MLNIYWLPLFDFVFPGVLQKVRLITRLKKPHRPSGRYGKV